MFGTTQTATRAPPGHSTGGRSTIGVYGRRSCSGAKGRSWAYGTTLTASRTGARSRNRPCSPRPTGRAGAERLLDGLVAAAPAQVALQPFLDLLVVQLAVGAVQQGRATEEEPRGAERALERLRLDELPLQVTQLAVLLHPFG